MQEARSSLRARDARRFFSSHSKEKISKTSQKFWTNFCWSNNILYGGLSGTKACISCRSRRELSNVYLLANIGFDTAENELLKARTKSGNLEKIQLEVHIPGIWNASPVEPRGGSSRPTPKWRRPTERTPCVARRAPRDRVVQILCFSSQLRSRKEKYEKWSL